MKFDEVLKLKTHRERVLMKLFLQARAWHDQGHPSDARRLLDLWRRLRLREDSDLSPDDLMRLLDASLHH